MLNHDFLTEGELHILEGWFDKLLLICQWGDDQHSLLDCSKRQVPVIHWVAYGGEFLGESPSFEVWFDDGLNDVDLWKRVVGQPSIPGSARDSLFTRMLLGQNMQAKQGERRTELIHGSCSRV